MAYKTTHIYTIRCLTNTHPGSGDTNFGLVDKLVQRNPITGAPTIHASSIKGAIREYFANQLDEKHNNETLCKIFGSPPKNKQIDEAYSQKESSDQDPGRRGIKQGDLGFMSADLLLLPVMNREISGAPYNLRYNQSLYNKWENKIETLAGKDAIGENWLKVNYQNARPMNEGDFKEAYNDLPVVARNYLENGISKNLWYEEVVPRETVFAFAVCGSEACLKNLNEGWDKAKGKGLNGKGEGCVIQIGANATIGYGYCLIKKV